MQELHLEILKERYVLGDLSIDGSRSQLQLVTVSSSKSNLSQENYGLYVKACQAIVRNETGNVYVL
jgi:hypothetical protein